MKICPECKQETLVKWRERGWSDPEDSEPRAQCVNPDCSYEY